MFAVPELLRKYYHYKNDVYSKASVRFAELGFEDEAVKFCLLAGEFTAVMMRDSVLKKEAEAAVFATTTFKKSVSEFSDIVDNFVRAARRY
jgi:hypothetical protein